MIQDSPEQSSRTLSGSLELWCFPSLHVSLRKQNKKFPKSADSELWTSRPAALTLFLCLCLLLFRFLSGSTTGDGGWGRRPRHSGSTLLAASSSCRQTADRESNSLRGSSETLWVPSAVASATSSWAGLTLGGSLTVLFDRREILGFLLITGSLYSSGRECFGRCAGEELGVSLSGLTWASGTVRRFCCGWNSLLHRNTTF